VSTQARAPEINTTYSVGSRASAATSSRWHQRFLARSAAQRAKIVREVEAVFKRLGAHRGLRERERGRYRVGEGVAAGSPVLVDLNACAEGLNDKTLEDIQSTRCFIIFSGRLPCPEPKLSVF
jgi:hypothetical protein